MLIKIKNEDPCGYVEAQSLAQLNDGNSHIVVDDGCYILVNRIFEAGGNDSDTKATDLFTPSPWIFREALDALTKLPKLGHPEKVRALDPCPICKGRGTTYNAGSVDSSVYCACTAGRARQRAEMGR